MVYLHSGHITASFSFTLPGYRPSAIKAEIAAAAIEDHAGELFRSFTAIMQDMTSAVCGLWYCLYGEMPQTCVFSG